MFSENEIATMVEIPEVLEAITAVRKDFITNEANFLEISEHDFLSLIMMTPTVGMARANGSISLFEELALNKMARKMSKGGFFLKIDPVAHAMKFLIKNYEAWEGKFFDVIKLCMRHTFDTEELKNKGDANQPFAKAVMSAPYAFVGFISSFFLPGDAHVADEHSISKVEFEQIKDIGTKLELNEYALFNSFCNTFTVK